jgi:hypothetical protein
VFLFSLGVLSRFWIKYKFLSRGWMNKPLGEAIWVEHALEWALKCPQSKRRTLYAWGLLEASDSSGDRGPPICST